MNRFTRFLNFVDLLSVNILKLWSALASFFLDKGKFKSLRLKSIRLAGFKSFVDPTTVPFQSNMAAIVGRMVVVNPSVIDSVRWVMGESSAKNLRGDSMIDVIFNGSVIRRPVSRASVDLVFDDAEGRALGEYVLFAEVAVKRWLGRADLTAF